MKTIAILILLLVVANSVDAQDKYISRSGHIWFYGKTPLEVIEAHNNQVATILNSKNGEIAFDMIMKSFKFEKALMEEHFNENYVNSAKYPKCTFKGKILDFDSKLLTGSNKVVVEGEMTLNGVTKKIKVNGTLENKDGKILAKAKFKVRPEDFNIEIPKLVRDKIPEFMDVNVEIAYELKK